MNFNAHKYRNEVRTVLSGEDKTIAGGMVQTVKPDYAITILASSKHIIMASICS